MEDRCGRFSTATVGRLVWDVGVEDTQKKNDERDAKAKRRHDNHEHGIEA